MTESSDWIYCRLVDRGSIIFPREPFWFGQVEFSDKGKDDELCASALAKSMTAFAVSGTGEGWAHLMRARLLLPRLSAEDTRKFGAFHLSEAVQAFNAHLSVGLGKLRTTDAGYLYDVRKRTVHPLLPPWTGRGLKATQFMLDDSAHHPLHVLNTLYVAPTAFGQLGDAFRRSSHWRDLAEQADDEGEALLLYWMAAECLSKQRDDESIAAKLLAAGGFPTGLIAKALHVERAKELTSIPGHRLWRKQLATLFDALRIARNKIVHAGYRHVDLPDLLREDQRALGMLVLPLVTQCLARMALQALELRAFTLAEMWQGYDALFAPLGVIQHARWFIGRLESGESTAWRSSRPRVR